MEGTDIQTGNKDTNSKHDHTYYGNGCPNTWGNDGDLGSNTACSTRIVQTDDTENQKNGTYYHNQAATLGEGDAMGTDNAITPDTFCPLGWQLPYGGTGGDYYNKSKSFNYLITLYGYSSGEIGSKKMRSYPISYVLSGRYYWVQAMLYMQTIRTHFWTSTNKSGGNYYYFNLGPDYFVDNDFTGKKMGLALRCIPELAT
ncbi:hypothetical protein IKE07_01160 [Candidatus Saccharibacteria bacterium]|nr:hypothetical protein [Candidatus Saccharibacteria bacterium]